MIGGRSSRFRFFLRLFRRMPRHDIRRPLSAHGNRLPRQIRPMARSAMTLDASVYNDTASSGQNKNDFGDHRSGEKEKGSVVRIPFPRGFMIRNLREARRAYTF